MWVVREGYEGLVRGNGDDHKAEKPAIATHKEVHLKDESFIHNLRFGDGELLRDGTSDHASGRTLKGRYIVRVGWDDVRGWFGVVRRGSPLCYPSLTRSPGWHFVRYGAFHRVPDTRRSSGGSIQSDQGRD